MMSVWGWCAPLPFDTHCFKFIADLGQSKPKSHGSPRARESGEHRAHRERRLYISRSGFERIFGARRGAAEAKKRADPARVEARAPRRGPEAQRRADAVRRDAQAAPQCKAEAAKEGDAARAEAQRRADAARRDAQAPQCKAGAAGEGGAARAEAAREGGAAPAEAQAPPSKPAKDTQRTLRSSSSLPDLQSAQDGAYLIFEPIQYGTMSLVWSRRKIAGALAYGMPGAEVPDYKYKHGGKSELCRNVSHNKQTYYEGWTMFVRACDQFKCTVVDYSRAESSAPIPTTLWLHREEDSGVQRVLPNTPFTTDGIDVMAAIYRDNSALNMPSMSRETFMKRCLHKGHFITLDPGTHARGPRTGSN